MTISKKNKQIISEAFGAQDIKNELHGRLFEKYLTQENNPDEPPDNLSEFQKLREHSQDFRNFTKKRFEQGFTQKQNETDNQK